MTSALDCNQSDLDRLLLELNAVQQSAPCVAAGDGAAPVWPTCSFGGGADVAVSPPPQERNGRHPHKDQSTVNSSVKPLSSPAPHANLAPPTPQQVRMSASYATRELDELMASLSDFKPASLDFCLQEPATSSTLTTIYSPDPASLAPPTVSNLSHLASLELHIDEEGGANNSSPLPLHHGHNSSEPELGSPNRLDVSTSSLVRTISSTSSSTSGASVNTVLNHKPHSPPPLSRTGSAPLHRPALRTALPRLTSDPNGLSTDSTRQTSDPTQLTSDPCPSLEEALDKLLAMSLSQEEVILKKEVEMEEEVVVASDRSSVRPDTLTATLTGSLDWTNEEEEDEEEELAMWEGSLTPLTEASWMDESLSPSSCPGTPETPPLERVSASGHLKWVIRRSKETPNVHPMTRDGPQRRRLGPILVNKTSSQDRMIQELQGRLGLGRPDHHQHQHHPDHWMTPGHTATPLTGGGAVELEEVALTLDSPLIPPSPKKSHPPATIEAPPLDHYSPAVKPASPPPPLTQGPPPPQQMRVEKVAPPLAVAAPLRLLAPPTQAPGSTSPLPRSPQEMEAPPPPVALVSVGCQTEYNTVFPPLQVLMAQSTGGATGGHSEGNKLDSMLGSLQSDLNKLGVHTLAKGVCGACCKPIVGQVVTALGQTWHPEHFVCCHCQQDIGSRNFFERDGLPYCEHDYQQLFSPRCFYCSGAILDKVVTALEQTWHPEHFFCAQCGSFFGPEGFHEKDGKAYCRKDFLDMFAPKCGGCAAAILDNYVSALSRLWHPECFVCRECFTPFVNGSFFEHDGRPYCQVHYHERRGSLCSGCQQPITGRCITAMARKFHPEHFVCAFCLKQLNKGTFKEQKDKPYCHDCFLKVFS